MIENKDWELDAVKLANTGVMSWRDIAIQVGKPKSTVSDLLRNYFQTLDGLSNAPEATQQVLNTKFKGGQTHDNSRILVISDLHAPYNDPKALEFLQTLKDRYDFTRIILAGRQLDQADRGGCGRRRRRAAGDGAGRRERRFETGRRAGTLAEARENLHEAVELVLAANREIAREAIGAAKVIREPLKIAG